MQTPNLPIQVNNAGAGAAPARAKQGARDDGQFSQALSREVGQRQQQEAAAPARQNGPAKTAQADKPAAPKQAAAEPARPAKPAADSKEAAAEDSASEAAQAAATSPVVDMLALVASFNPPVATAAVPQAAAEPLLAGSGKVPGLDAQQIAAFQLPALAKSLPGSQAPATVDGAPTEYASVMGQAAIDAGTQAVATDAAPLGTQPKTDPATAGQAPAKALADFAQLATPRMREAAPEAAALTDLPATAPASAPVQQASLALAQAVNGTGANDKIAARVGTPGWDNQVGQKIVWMIAGKEQSATLTLNPPDMGPMQVVLSVTNDHATVAFTAAQPEVRQALEDAMPKLRDMMSESGIALGNASVSDQSRDQQQAQAGSARQGGGSGRQGGNGNGGEAEAAPAARPVRGGESQGLVDTFA